MQSTIITLDSEDVESLIKECDQQILNITSEGNSLAARESLRTSTKVTDPDYIESIKEPRPIESNFPTLVSNSSRYAHISSRTLKR